MVWARLLIALSSTGRTQGLAQTPLEPFETTSGFPTGNVLHGREYQGRLSQTL